MTNWVNNFEQMYAFTVVDPSSGLAQITVRTNRASSFPLRDLGDALSDVMVEQPILMRRRLKIVDFEDVVPSVASPVCSVKNVWKVTAWDSRSNVTRLLYIPCADASLLPAGTDVAQLSVEPFLTLVNELEDTWFEDGSDPIVTPMQIQSIVFTALD